MNAAYVILGALAVVVAVIALAWYLVLHRLDEGNFEVGGPLHPPWTQGKTASLAPRPENEQALVHARSAHRQLEREEQAGATRGLGEAKDRNVAHGWGG